MARERDGTLFPVSGKGTTGSTLLAAFLAAATPGVEAVSLDSEGIT